MIPIVNDGPGGEPDETFQLMIVPPPDQPRALIGNRSTTNNITITDGGKEKTILSLILLLSRIKSKQDTDYMIRLIMQKLHVY